MAAANWQRLTGIDDHSRNLTMTAGDWPWLAQSDDGGRKLTMVGAKWRWRPKINDGRSKLMMANGNWWWLPKIDDRVVSLANSSGKLRRRAANEHPANRRYCIVPLNDQFLCGGAYSRLQAGRPHLTADGRHRIWNNSAQEIRMKVDQTDHSAEPIRETVLPLETGDRLTRFRIPPAVRSHAAGQESGTRRGVVYNAIAGTICATWATAQPTQRLAERLLRGNAARW
jgi:hypothetical protein